MTTSEAAHLLEQFRAGKIPSAEVLRAFQAAPVADLGFAQVDMHRALRKNFPEVIFGAGKTPEQVVKIAAKLLEHGQQVLITRVTTEHARALRKKFKLAVHYALARCVTIEKKPLPKRTGFVAVACAGTSDLPVAEEAAVTAEIMGNRVERVRDVGVAGLHRMLARMETLQKANVIIAVAGMEGALPSVLAGLVSKPVIAVPTSVGYGASFGGIAGDMFIAALLDLGVDARKLERELKKLKLAGYHLHISRQQKSAIAGLKFDVHLAHDHAHEHDPGHHHEGEHRHDHTHEEHDHDDQRNFAEIKQLISRSKLSAWVKQKSIAVFQRIAVAEGKIHGLPPGKVHFHEVGAVDSIVDIVGAAIALELLGKPRVFASPVIEGTGWIRCAHGRFPVPAPATLAILGVRGIGLTQCEEPHELVTPTGAALLAEFVESFGAMENLVAEKIGFGLGTRENKTRPNVLRAVLGSGDKCRVASDTKRVAAEIVSPVTRHPSPLDWETDRVAVLETNLDDCSGEILGHFVETALAAGALDIFHTPIQMKKNRPGVLLTVLCAENDADKFNELLLRETTAFGIRKTIAERRKLRREFAGVKTSFGNVTVKLGRLGGKVVQAAPEFESARKLAAQKKVPVKQIYEAAVQAAKRLKE